MSKISLSRVLCKWAGVRYFDSRGFACLRFMARGVCFADNMHAGVGRRVFLGHRQGARILELSRKPNLYFEIWMGPMRFFSMKVLPVFLTVFCTVGVLSCTPGASLIESFFNNTTSLGGDVPGGRGNVQVSFINNTPYRAIFTVGTYDPLSLDVGPFVGQFTAGPDPTRRLEGNSSSPINTLVCGRALALGDSQLIELVRGEDELMATMDEAALITGIAFSDKPLGEDGDDQPTAGLADPMTTLQGSQFQCESLLIYTFEVDANEPDGFRIDLDVILP